MKLLALDHPGNYWEKNITFLLQRKLVFVKKHSLFAPFHMLSTFL